MNEQVKGRVKITEDMFRVDDYDLMEKLQEIYGITYDWFDEECGQFVYSEPVTWIYNDEDYYEIQENDFNV